MHWLNRFKSYLTNKQESKTVGLLQHLAVTHSTAEVAHYHSNCERNTPPAPPPALTAALACDPETDQELLWYIATEAPELRKWIAANPKATPELLETISQLGGPGVKEALTVLLKSLSLTQPSN